MWPRLPFDCFVDPNWRKPGLRPNGAEMSRSTFLALVASWSATVSVLLLAAIIIRLAA
ncbi:hypothetical protein JQ615_38800 [Bradyrhizobium jicamae]|uniref:Uncharacterized protein n=1 Tax=Bradyrhizobium jicamae TaxID=280332 RepID=A0ABS5FWZ7_9BRAD|nr:hypothetical protein [Bradyrhizobium jicamae]MBR0801313.1 hypothetical protein [Bradyrhizobium jicamae]MBR0931751.1 hypothetical protein [Bradyrhizobium jicamae]